MQGYDRRRPARENSPVTPAAPRRSRRAPRRPAVPAALLAVALAAAACAAPPMSPSGSRSQSPSGAGNRPQPAAPAAPERDSGQSTAGGQAGDQSAGDGRVESSPGGKDGPGGEVTGTAPGDDTGVAGSGGTVEEGARSDGGGTPPTGSGAAGSTAGAGDAASVAADPAPAPPITPPGSRFPEPLDVSLTRLAELPVPLAVAFRTQEPGSLYVALRHGEVVRLRGEGGRVDSSATLRRDGDAVLDMSARVDTRGEMGLLGLAFSPAGDRLYTSSVNRRQVSELWEWPVAADGRVDSGGSRLVLSL